MTTMIKEMRFEVTPEQTLRKSLHTHKWRLRLDLDTLCFMCECGKKLTVMEVEKILNR